jgi:two-component system, cell cycle response regulator
MVISSIRTLLIEDNPADARLIREALAEVPEAAFEVEWAEGLAKGLERLEGEAVDLVLLDLHLPESWGLATFTTTQACAPDVPIIVWTGLDDRELALKAVRDGAQDYLVKGQVEGPSLVRSMQNAVVRHRLQRETDGHTSKDELTGLYNRQGFLALGEQLLRFADLAKRTLTLVYADVDGLEKINQAFGREEGDAALRDIAEALRATFRESDLIARVGGDEFAWMCSGFCDRHMGEAKAMFQQALRTRYSPGERPYALAVSWGVSAYDPATSCSMATLIKRAEAQAQPDYLGPAP